jgi:phosphate transport system permease protein
MVGAAMLGLGRALGETIAVALVLSTSFEVSAHLTEPGGNTFAANIANRFAESGQTGVGALIASGLVLFAITLIVNAAARFVVARKPA